MSDSMRLRASMDIDPCATTDTTVQQPNQYPTKIHLKDIQDLSTLHLGRARLNFIQSRYLGSPATSLELAKSELAIYLGTFCKNACTDILSLCYKSCYSIKSPNTKRGFSFRAAAITAGPDFTHECKGIIKFLAIPWPFVAT